MNLSLFWFALFDLFVLKVFEIGHLLAVELEALGALLTVEINSCLIVFPSWHLLTINIIGDVSVDAFNVAHIGGYLLLFPLLVYCVSQS